MKSKLSTGYLTPQASKSKNASDNRRSINTLGPLPEINDGMFEKLMSCPIKRQLILKLLDSEKDNIDAYKKKMKEKQKSDRNSPLNKLSNKQPCESPTALRRRRALEQLNRSSPLAGSSENFSRSNSVNSHTSEKSASSNKSSAPYEKLLEGVVAFVEVKSKGQDRSAGVRALMCSMGAQIRDNFTKDVTHVVFKDGSYTTFQKAKLMNMHLVSVLWIEAVRTNGVRVPERKFPALGADAYDHNISTICSQMQKEYEDIIKDELQRSLATGTPLPTTKALIDRRRTMMSPNISKSSSYRSLSRDLSAEDKEVDQIINRARIKSRMTMDFLQPMEGNEPDLTSDDDDSGCGAVVNGDVVTKNDKPLLALNNITNIDVSNMDLTGIDRLKTPVTPKTRRSLFSMDEYLSGNITQGNNSSTSFYNKKTPKITENNNDDIENVNESLSDTPNISLYRRRTESVWMPPDNSTSSEFKTPVNNKNNTGFQILSKNSSNMSPIVHHNIVVKEAITTVQSSNNSTNDIPSLKLSSGSKSRKSDENEKIISSDMSSLKISEEKSSSDKMSSLRISADNSSNQKTTSTNMSMLQLSTEISSISEVAKKTSSRKSTSFTKVCRISEDSSFSPLQQKTFNDIMDALETPPINDENITKRSKKKSLKVPLPKSCKVESDEGKTIDESPTKKTKVTKTRSAKKNNSSTPKSDTSDTSTRKSTRLTTNKGKASVIKQTKNQKRRSDSPIDVQIAEFSPTKKSKESGQDEVNKDSQHFSNKQLSDEKRLRNRKLYDPGDTNIETDKVSDDEERRHKRQQALKKASSEEEIATTAVLLQVNKESKADTSNDSNCSNKSDESEIKVPVRRTRKKKIVEDVNVTVNGERDEQRELAKEILGHSNPDGNKPNSDSKVSPNNLNNESAKKVTMKGISVSTGKITKRRQSLRLISNVKMTKNNPNITDPMTPVRNRRSTMEFQSTAEMSAKRKLKIDKMKQPSIVCTKLHKDDIMVFNQIVKKLGNFIIEDEVSSKTTHLVAGEPKRTINMLRAMATGCWILKHEWVLKSLEVGKWLPEEDYEETRFSPAVQQSRLHRQAFGPTYTMDIFKDCGKFYVAKGSVPRCSDLRELIGTCKGKVTSILRNAEILVGGYVNQSGVICVKETWILDSITKYKKMPFKNYLIKSDNGVMI